MEPNRLRGRPTAVRCCVVLLVSALLLAGCGEPVNSACPAVYSPPGVLFKLPTRAQFTEPVQFRACADQDCVTSDDTSSAGASVPWLVAGSRQATAPGTVTARLTVTGRSSHSVLLDASTQVTLHKITVGVCEQGPGGYQATVHMANGKLVPG
jgi:hypothetical protein